MHDYTCSYYDSQQVTSDEGGQVICFGEMEQSNLDMVKVISKRHIDYVREVHILARLIAATAGSDRSLIRDEPTAESIKMVGLLLEILYGGGDDVAKGRAEEL